MLFAIYIIITTTKENGCQIMKYRVHRFDIDLSKDHSRLEQFLNNLEGEVVTIIPNVNPKFTPGGMGAKVDFIVIIEKI